MPVDHRLLFVRPDTRASSARLPPSPLLSARMMMATYLIVTTIIIDQNIRLSTPMMCSGSSASLWCPAKVSRKA